MLPNILSASRIIASPFFILFMIQDEAYFRWLSLFLVSVISLTDFFDGYYARKFNATTEFGKYLDPIADKVFVWIVFFTFYFILGDFIPTWMLILIVFRDLSVTILRQIFNYKRLVFKTSRLAKNKTF